MNLGFISYVKRGRERSFYRVPSLLALKQVVVKAAAIFLPFCTILGCFLASFFFSRMRLIGTVNGAAEHTSGISDKRNGYQNIIKHY